MSSSSSVSGGSVSGGSVSGGSVSGSGPSACGSDDTGSSRGRGAAKPGAALRERSRAAPDARHSHRPPAAGDADDDWHADLDHLCAQLDRVAAAATATAAADAADAADADAAAARGEGEGDAEAEGSSGASSAQSGAAALRALGAGLESAFGPDTPGGVAAAIDAGCQLVSRIAMHEGADGDAEHQRDRARVLRALSALYYADQALSAAAVAGRVLADEPGAAVSDNELAAGVARFAPPEAKVNGMQQLLLYLLNTAQAQGYRRRDGALYRRLRAPCTGGHDTHAWEYACEMRDFVYQATRKEVKFDMWLNLTAMRCNLSAAVDHLTTCHDVQLPELRRDRHVFSYTDGIYLAAQDRFVRYGTPEHAALPTDLVAARYFAAPFGGGDGGDGDGDGDWYDLPTPHMQSIMDTQGMDPEVCRWMYVMLGRLLYDVGEKDGWQVIPYFKGAASSGKSTLLTCVARNFYEPGDVGTLSNNIERKFGLSALADKLLFIGPEIKADIQLEQAEFQSMVSGETVQVATKFKTAHTVDWRVPGALAGNEVPGWVDNSGSINRRIVLFEFPKRVHNGDMQLGRKIEAELPTTLAKCNRAYLAAVARVGFKSVWTQLPAAFHEAKKDHSESVNSFVEFLNHGSLQFGGGMYVPYEHFIAAYIAYCTRMSLKPIKTSGTKVAQQLAEVNCHITTQVSLMYPRIASVGVGGSGSVSASAGAGRNLQTTRFVKGCDIAAPALDNECML